MATDLGQQQKVSPAPKHEAFVQEQLERARRRVRRLDLLGSLCILGIATLGYGLVMAVLDRALSLPTPVRAAALVAFGLGACAYAALLVYRQVRWSVNPYYAAKRLEETVPGAKNSLINYLDLHSEEVPSAIRANLGRRAATDLKEADLDAAISGRRVMWLGAGLGGLLLVLLVWYFAGPAQLSSLLQRAFAPFEKVSIAANTRIEFVPPHGGDLTVGVRQDVQIRVRVSGRVPGINQPDSLRLHIRYTENGPYTSRPLDEDAHGEWFKIVLADEVQTGFWYKVSGGDSETPEHRVRLKTAPQVTKFEVKYRYRPYVGWPESGFTAGPTETRVRPEIKALRGTEVTILTRTNRPWHEGQLVLHDGPKPRSLPGEPVADDPNARRFTFTLDNSGHFQVLFASPEGEPNSDRSRYEMIAVEDRKPAVSLLQPRKDVTLPANGTLPLEGIAEDDFGLTGMTLRLAVKDGPEKPALAPKPYRPGVSFKLVDGTYPPKLNYKDFIALDKITTPAGEGVELAPGTVLEYWLEAVDSCDYPEAGVNVGRSRSYLVTIAPPDRDEKKQQEQRGQAEKATKEHQKQQDEQQARQNQQAAERQKEQQLSPEEQAKREQQRQEEFKRDMEQLAEADKRRQEEEQKKGNAKDAGGGGEAGEQKDPGQQDPKQQPGEAKQEQKQPEKGEASKQKDDGAGGKADAGSARDEGAGQQPQQPQPQPGAEKGPGEKGGQDGAAKDQKGDGGQNQQSAAKDQGPQDPKKPGEPQGDAKGEGDKGKKEQMAKGKDGDQGGAGGQPKPGPEQGGAGDKSEVAKGKDDGKGGAGKPEPQQAQGGAKDGPQKGDAQAAQSKNGGPADAKQEASAQKGQGQPDPKQPPQTAQGGAKGQPPQQAQGANKPGEGGQQASAAKEGGKDPGNAQKSDNRSATPEQAAKAGEGKTDHDPDPAATAAERRKNATPDDLAKMKKALERPDDRPASGKELTQARDELSKLKDEARDPEVRKGAEDLLKQLDERAKGPAPGKAKTNDGAEQQVAQAGNKGDGQQKKSDQPPEAGGAKGQPPGEKQAGDTKAGDPGKQLAKKGDRQSDTGNPDAQKAGQAGFDDGDLRGGPVDWASARRAGDLQLENLKKKLEESRPWLKRPDGKPWTAEDEKRFLEQARQYQEWIRQQEAQAGIEGPRRPGQASTLPSVGPRQVGQGPNATRDPLEVGTAQPPPEYREAQSQFSKRPRE